MRNFENDFRTILRKLDVDDGSDEGGLSRSLFAIENLHREIACLTQERDDARSMLREADARLATHDERSRLAVQEALLGSKTDAAIDRAYREGRLIRGRDDDGRRIASPREARLRRIANDDGIAALIAELAEMPVIIPLGQQQISDDGAPRERAPVGTDALASAAEQLGMDPDELIDYAGEMGGAR